MTFEHLSLEQGLSDSVVMCIAQDRKGFLWVETENGLNRYDGYTFTRYKHNPEDSYSLSSNKILSLHEDHLSVLWIGTEDGLQIYDRDTERFLHYPYDPDDPKSLSHNTIWSIYEDQAGVLWIGTSGGLNRFDRMNETFKHYPDSEIPGVYRPFVVIILILSLIAGEGKWFYLINDIIHVSKNHQIGTCRKIFWISILWFLNIFAIPVYWYPTRKRL